MKSGIGSVLLMVALLLAACDNLPVERELSQAAGLMYDRPDSALLVLKRIDRRTLTARRLRARHALLYSQALDKNYIDTDNDSLIRPAREYFRSHGLVHDRFLADYYYGRVLYNRGEYAQALLLYLDIEETGRKLDDPYTLGMLYHDISALYRSQYDYQSMLKYAELAYDCYRDAGLESHGNYALFYLGEAYFNLERYDCAGIYYRKALSVAEQQCDTSMQYACLSNLAAVYNDLQTPDLAEKVLDRIRRDLHCSWNFYNYIEMASVCHSTNRLDSARFYLEQARFLVKDDFYRSSLLRKVSAIVYYKDGNFQLAAKDFQYCLNAQDSMVRVALQKSYVSLHRDYLEQQRQISQQLLMLMKQRMIIFCIFWPAVALSIVPLFLFYRRKKQREIDRCCLVIENVDQINSALQQQKAYVEARLDGSKRLLESRFELFSRLAEVDYQHSDTPKAIFNEVKRWLNRYSAGDEMKREIEELVNYCYDDILVRVRRELPELKEAEIELLALYYAGFSSSVISLLVRITVGNVYTKKCRLKSKIEASEAPSKAEFLARLT